MEGEIGDVAGSIWLYLDKHCETTLSNLRQRVKLPEQIIRIAIGGLAREGKLNFVREGRTVKVDLRPREGCLTSRRQSRSASRSYRRCYCGRTS